MPSVTSCNIFYIKYGYKNKAWGNKGYYRNQDMGKLRYGNKPRKVNKPGQGRSTSNTVYHKTTRGK